jgi:hypothetical protein
VSKAKRVPRARTIARGQLQKARKLAGARRKLIALEPGGSPERPCQVPSASVVEARAQSWACPDCDGPLRSDEHAAESHGGRMLRVVRLGCRSCGAPLELYFQIVEPLAH